MNFTKDQLLTLMNTIDFATDNDALTIYYQPFPNYNG